MTPARPLHELLTDLVGDAEPAHGDPQEYLAANGHADLPPELVAEAVVSYADTAPVEVAEQLAPYVTAHSAVPADDAPSADWFDLITTAPTGELEADPELDDLSSSSDGDTDADADASPGPEFDFGTGSADLLDEPLESATPDESAAASTSSASDSAAEVGDDESRAWTDLEPADPALTADPDDDSDPEDLDAL